MLLNWKFSTDYYLRVVELAIRDGTRILVYNRKQSMLDTWLQNDPLLKEHENKPEILQQVLEELFSHSNITHSITSRLLAIIDIRLRQETPKVNWLYKIFFPNIFAVKTRIVQKLLVLKEIIFLERQRPLERIFHVAHTMLNRRAQSFSSWEDFSHNLTIPLSDSITLDTASRYIAIDASSQLIVDALLSFLENQSMDSAISLELLDQFLSEKIQPVNKLSEKNYRTLIKIKELFIGCREDFQTIVGGIIAGVLSEVLESSLVGVEILSPRGRTFVQEWEEDCKKASCDVVLIQSLLAEAVRHIVSRNLKNISERGHNPTPEQIGSIYSIRDRSAQLWVKMMHVLLMRWLLDFDSDVYTFLKRYTTKHAPETDFWCRFRRLAVDLLWDKK